MSRVSYTGACLCGAVKYKLAADTKDIKGVTACHCQQCRRWSGHHWTSIHGPKSGLKIIDGKQSVRWYQSSDLAKRGFCKTCGSTLFWHGEGYPELKDQIDISAGSIDNAKELRLVRHIFCRFKGTYYDIKDGVPTHDTFPGA